MYTICGSSLIDSYTCRVGGASTPQKRAERYRQSEVQDSKVIPYPFGTRWRLWHLANICKLIYHLLFTVPRAWHFSVFDYTCIYTLRAWLRIHSQLDSCHLRLLPYSGKLSREKTFTNFKVCSYSRKLQNWGAWHLLAATPVSNLRKISPWKSYLRQIAKVFSHESSRYPFDLNRSVMDRAQLLVFDTRTKDRIYQSKYGRKCLIVTLINS